MPALKKVGKSQPSQGSGRDTSDAEVVPLQQPCRSLLPLRPPCRRRRRQRPLGRRRRRLAASTGIIRDVGGCSLGLDAQRGGQAPRQVVGVLDAGVHAEAPRGRQHVRCIPAELQRAAAAAAAPAAPFPPSIFLDKNRRGIGKYQSKRPCKRRAHQHGATAARISQLETPCTVTAEAGTCPKRLVIEARWGSKPLALAGKTANHGDSSSKPF
jgi:hypothetical protein